MQEMWKMVPHIRRNPLMLPDRLRKREEDLKFLEKNKNRLPSGILQKGKPHHL